MTAGQDSRYFFVAMNYSMGLTNTSQLRILPLTHSPAAIVLMVCHCQEGIVAAVQYYYETGVSSDSGSANTAAGNSLIHNEKVEPSRHLQQFTPTERLWTYENFSKQRKSEILSLDSPPGYFSRGSNSRAKISQLMPLNNKGQNASQQASPIYNRVGPQGCTIMLSCSLICSTLQLVSIRGGGKIDSFQANTLFYILWGNRSESRAA